MADEEVSVISHLLEVEQNAYLQTKSAQDDASKMLADAKTKADSEFKIGYEKIALELENDYKQKLESVSTEHKKIIEQYKTEVEKTEQDKVAFNNFVSKVINEA